MSYGHAHFLTIKDDWLASAYAEVAEMENEDANNS